ncbi:Cro/CI family transcriptional regulator [Aeromonas enteropelogenes]|uniref:Cro/CI family transcriptional regulator n=1 Tax=Aeromonas enteropelogenes TaxID=29489 RepID=UPI003B9E15DE
MKKQDAIDHFGGTRALATALGCSTQAISQWGEQVPPRRAYEIQEITEGALRANEGKKHANSTQA